jgi:hypothetical protein
VALGGTRGSGGAAEVAVGEDAVPELAHECGAEKVRGLVRWDAEEDLLNELLRQLAPHNKQFDFCKVQELILIQKGLSKPTPRDRFAFYRIQFPVEFVLSQKTMSRVRISWWTTYIVHHQLEEPCSARVGSS